MTTSPAHIRAASLLALIRRGEADKTNDEAYTVIIGNRQGKLAKPITSMTLDEVLTQQQRWIKNRWGSAAGAYQIIRKTLAALKDSLKLTGKERFDPALQDRLAEELLRQRGLEDFVSGKLSVAAFGLSLAKEWASLPVLTAVKGAREDVDRGSSYYSGDGVNRSRIQPAEIEAVLAGLRGTAPPAPAPKASSDSILSVQQRLKDLGYTEVGTIDGVMGPMTEAAILAFKKDNNVTPLSTTIDDRLIVALAKAPPRELAAGRVEASPKEVREQVPEARNSFRNRITSAITAALSFLGAAMTGVLNNIPGARDAVQPLMDLGAHVPPWVYFLLVAGIAAFIYWQAHRGEKSIISAFQTGERR